MTTQKRDFDKSAATWDEEPRRVKLAADVAATIMLEVQLSPEMDVLDYGCGTGLMSLHLQPHVHSITGADSSREMLAVLAAKLNRAGIGNVKPLFLDLEKEIETGERFHLIVSSMTMHHVEHLAPLFSKFHRLLLPGGKLCIADLDAEEGRFHNDNTGVMHFGFGREQVLGLLRDSGFVNASAVTAATVSKHNEGEERQDFTLFLAIGEKQEKTE